VLCANSLCLVSRRVFPMVSSGLVQVSMIQLMIGFEMSFGLS
jgi:hypothetical protein